MLNKLLVGAVAAGAMSVPLAGVAWASPTTDGANQTTTAAAGTQSVQNPGAAVSFNGQSLVQFGNSAATSTPGNNLAIAFYNSTATANGNTATANGTGNLAIAINGSTALAGFGNNNTATAINGSQANAHTGNNNTATAINGSHADAFVGNNNTGTAIFNGSQADAEFGNNNTATATNGSQASTRFGSNNTVTATDGSTVDISGVPFGISADANTVTARCGGSVVFSAQSNQIVTSAPCEAG
jgi:hypothetical protein